MKFRLQNIGIIKDTEIELNKFTVLCGKNNTGKTYITYAIYGFLRQLHPFIMWQNANNDEENTKILREKGEYIFDIVTLIDIVKSNINDDNQSYVEELHKIFSANSDTFSHSNFEYIDSINIDEIINEKIEEDFDSYQIRKEVGSKELKLIVREKDKAMVFERYDFSIINFLREKFFFKDFFILSAERTGVQLFQKELDKNRSLLLDSVVKQKLSNEDFNTLTEKNISRFALPIEENINFIRDLEYTEKRNSFLKKEHPELLTYIEEMLGVRYQVLDGRLVVVNPKDNTAIPSYLASTSVRSLFSLHLWLKHQVQKGDLLMIDEPEINLHPENQIKLARLLVRLVNVGIKVWITTHSDYIIKELNNLLMLSNNIENKAEVLKELNYDESEILNKEDINFYLAADGGCEKIEVDEYGVLKTTFDEIMSDINMKTNCIASLVDKCLGV